MSRQLKIHKPNATEMRQLQQLLEESPHAALCRWVEAVLFYAAGLNGPQIAEAIGVHTNTVYAYLHGFARLRLAFARGFKRRGAPSRITMAQMDEMTRIAEQSPTDFGLPYGRWSLAKLQAYVTRPHGLLKAISREHLRRVLKKRILTSAMSNASSLAMTHKGMQFWLEFEPFGDIYRATA
jgi:transposase